MRPCLHLLSRIKFTTMAVRSRISHRPQEHHLQGNQGGITMKTTDFSNVKVGDKIIYYTTGWYSHEVLATVTRVTPKQFEVDKCIMFRKKDGSMVGDNYINASYATNKDIERVQIRERKKFLNGRIVRVVGDAIKLSRFSIADLESIYEIIKKYES